MKEICLHPGVHCALVTDRGLKFSSGMGSASVRCLTGGTAANVMEQVNGTYDDPESVQERESGLATAIENASLLWGS